jgi:Flp pilus assembly pilin Flp
LIGRKFSVISFFKYRLWLVIVRIVREYRGQALVEYIIIFGLMSFLAVSFVKAISTFMNGTTGSLSYALTEKLTTGSCKRYCFYGAYGNGVE